MNTDQIAQRLDSLDVKLDAEFDKINTRLDHTVSKSDVNAAVLQAVGIVAAAVVGTVVILNAVGAFS